jgi:RNA polymerase sigma factor (sigma-70 family)
MVAAGNQPLIAAARQGESWAQRELAELIRGYARHVCWGTGPGGDAGLSWEDVAQEASRRMFTVGFEQYRAGGPERAYVYAIVRSTYLQMGRSARRRRAREEGGTALGAAGEDPERRTLLFGILTRLDEACRHLLERLYFDGANYAELASELNMAESSVRARSSRCMGRAREIAAE